MELFSCSVTQNIALGHIEIIYFIATLILMQTESLKKLKICYFLVDELKTID